MIKRKLSFHLSYILLLFSYSGQTGRTIYPLINNNSVSNNTFNRNLIIFQNRQKPFGLIYTHWFWNSNRDKLRYFFIHKKVFHPADIPAHHLNKLIGII